MLADRPSASATTAALITALANLEAASFNLWLIANNVGAKMEHGTEDPQQLGRALRQEVSLALTALFEWRRLRWALTVDAADQG